MAEVILSASEAVFSSARSTKAKAVEKDSKVTWPAGSLIEGCVISGKPASGDFVPEGSVGGHYASPGYKR